MNLTEKMTEEKLVDQLFEAIAISGTLKHPNHYDKKDYFNTKNTRKESWRKLTDSTASNSDKMENELSSSSSESSFEKDFLPKISVFCEESKPKPEKKKKRLRYDPSFVSTF